MLSRRADLDPHRIGLWGFSEGGWVAPLAASRSTQVSYVVLVGASGVSPARQSAWYLENKLRHEGVAGSPLRTISVTGTRFLTDTGLLPEADDDPMPALRRLRQPVLAMWGNDQRSPPAESASAVEKALRDGGNTDVTLRFFPHADHKLHVSPDGFQRGRQLTPGYVDTMASWAAGHEHRINDALPRQVRQSHALPLSLDTRHPRHRPQCSWSFRSRRTCWGNWYGACAGALALPGPAGHRDGWPRQGWPQCSASWDTSAS
ncbi:hypothetical protein GCM10010211_73900 [Streptomyces albospinus]|uniref:BAAT/Acyl-CoA thioester hydrolase C-terminal domain-containing protein n=1 Tax=Streptomyces albospinus TaxID=285515 RepID=A0ABQ2VLZ3_9ACTN|nr:hypothetical protein GCM10010211_73900 [Streptomyces albospinus]